jgi:tRNA threonylcarbamoyladenosine biosynthesis protein TsaB
MVMLALDTSTRYASVALVRERELVAELTWQAGQRHSNDLFERLNWLLAAHHLTPVDLTAIAVATGPGSFNGVRVALATAKSLSFALSLPLYASPTLDIIAWGAASAGATGTLYALLEAGRGQVYTARYRSDRERQTAEPWKPLSGYDVLTPGELAQRIAAESLVGQSEQQEQPVFFCGEWSPATQAALAAGLGTRARFAAAVGGRRASWLAELALQQAQRGEVSDALSLEPLYLRRPAITKSTKFALPSQVSQISQDSDRAGDNESAPGGEETADALHR